MMEIFALRSMKSHFDHARTQTTSHNDVDVENITEYTCHTELTE